MMIEARKKQKKYNISDIIKTFVTSKENQKTPIANLKFAENFTLYRTFIYSIVCGLNDDTATKS